MTKDELKRMDDQGLAAWDNHDSEAFVSMFADDFVWHDWTSAEPLRGREAAKAYFEKWMKAFPDLHTRRTSQVIGEDSFATELEFTGTNTGPLDMGDQTIPPTQKKITGHGDYFARIRDGKIVEFRTHPDIAGLMMQLGMMPTKH